MPGMAPASENDEGSPRMVISRLNHTAFDLAVYASQGPSPVTTQDSLPAADPALPGGIGYPQGSSNEEGCIRRADAQRDLLRGSAGPSDTIPLN